MRFFYMLMALSVTPLFGASLAAVLQPIVFEQPLRVKSKPGFLTINPSFDESLSTVTIANADALPLIEPKDALNIVHHHLEAEALALALENTLTERYHIDGNLKVKLFSAWASPLLCDPHWVLELTDAPRSIAQRMLLSFNVRSGEEVVGPYRLTVGCECWQESYFTKERISGRTQLLAEEFEVHAVDILSYPQSIVSASVDLKDYQLSQGVIANRPLFWRDIARRPTVKKGKMVNAVAQEGLLTLSMKCEVLTPGFEGDFVTLRNLQTRKEFQGRIKNEDTVEIYF